VANLQDDIHSSAAWIAQALTSSDYRADFTPQSLWEIDRFFDEHSRDGAAKSGGLLAEGLGARLFAIGSYAGEVVRRAVGGEWVVDDDDPEGEINIELLLQDGTRCWPVHRAMKRFQNGAEDGIAAWLVCMWELHQPCLNGRSVWGSSRNCLGEDIALAAVAG